MIPDKMKAAVMSKIRRIDIMEMDVPSYLEDEVLIRLRAVGVCGSDVHLFANGQIGRFIVKPPYILGHEAAGEVVAIGKDVNNLKVGDQIVMEPGIPCRRCEYCKSGRYNLCSQMKFWASPPTQGVLCEYTTHKADFCYKIADSISFEVATLAEPLSVGVHACRRGGIEPGKRVAILGMGPIGQTILLAAISFGATDILVSDVIDKRLDIARSLGAKEAINCSELKYKQHMIDFTQGERFDIVVDAAGAVQTALDAVDICKNGGTILMVGSTVQPKIEFPIIRIMQKELSILGSFRYTNTYSTVLNILLSQKALLEKLISHRFTLDQSQEAFDFALQNRHECMKVVINI